MSSHRARNEEFASGTSLLPAERRNCPWNGGTDSRTDRSDVCTTATCGISFRQVKNMCVSLTAEIQSADPKAPKYIIRISNGITRRPGTRVNPAKTAESQ